MNTFVVLSLLVSLVLASDVQLLSFMDSEGSPIIDQRAFRVVQVDESFIMAGFVDGLGVVKLEHDGDVDYAIRFSHDESIAFASEGRGLVYDPINDRILAFGPLNPFLGFDTLMLAINVEDGSLEYHQRYALEETIGFISEAQYCGSDQSVVVLTTSYVAKLDVSDGTPMWASYFAPLNGSFDANAMAIGSDDRIVVAGRWHPGNFKEFGIIMRLSSDGTSIDWIQQLRVDDRDTEIEAVTLLSDDSIVVAGNVASGPGDVPAFFGRFAYSDGSPIWVRDMADDAGVVQTTSIAVSQGDDAVAVALTRTGGIAVRFDSDGELQFSQLYDDDALNDVIACDMDGMSHFVAVGRHGFENQLFFDLGTDGVVLDDASSPCGSSQSKDSIALEDIPFEAEEIDFIVSLEGSIVFEEGDISSEALAFAQSSFCDASNPQLFTPSPTITESKTAPLSYGAALLLAVFVLFYLQ